MNWLAIFLRWIHIVAAITAVGGIIFMRFALLPSVQSLADDTRKALHEQIRSRWAKVVMLCIAVLLLGGLANYLIFVSASKAPEWADWKTVYGKTYHMVFGIKFLLAIMIFFVASALVGRADVFKPIRQNAKMWMTVNVILALIVVALSGILRITHVGPTLTNTPTVNSTEAGNG
jgi:uncharacterized membrane protein